MTNRGMRFLSSLVFAWRMKIPELSLRSRKFEKISKTRVRRQRIHTRIIRGQSSAAYNIGNVDANAGNALCNARRLSYAKLK